MIFVFHTMHSSNHSNTKTNVKIIAAFRTRTIELRETSCFLKYSYRRAPESRSSFFFESKIISHFPTYTHTCNLDCKGVYTCISHNNARTTF